MIFDRFEELFTSYPERWQDRRGFFEQIGAALEGNRLLRVLFCMSEEYLGEFDQHVSRLPGRSLTRFRLERLNRQTALACIREPLKETGTSYAPGVAEKLVTDLATVQIKTADGVSKFVGEFVEPSQLQFVCFTLWNSLPPTTTEITESQLEAYGDVDRSLSSFYEEVIARTAQATGINEGTLRRWLESTLITENDSRALIFRGHQHTASLPNEVIDELERQHFIRVELRGGERWYELSHDRFIQPIKESNRKWLLHFSGTEARLVQLEAQAAAWHAHGRDIATLLKDSELEEMNAFISRGGRDIRYSDTVAAFLNASAIQNQRQRSRRLRLTIAWVALSMLLVFTLLLIVAGQQRQIHTLKQLQQQHDSR